MSRSLVPGKYDPAKAGTGLSPMTKAPEGAFSRGCGRQDPVGRTDAFAREDQTSRATIIFLISAIAFAGFRPFGQVLAQFMMVWQR